MWLTLMGEGVISFNNGAMMKPLQYASAADLV
jgi:hypothetical protein